MDKMSSPTSQQGQGFSKSRPSTCASSNSRETWMTARGTTRMGKGILVFTDHYDLSPRADERATNLYMDMLNKPYQFNPPNYRANSGEGRSSFNITINSRGPDGRKNQDVKIPEDPQYVGIGESSPEKSSEVLYLYRPATGAPFHRAKCDIPGSIGWGLPRTGDPKTWPVHLNICSKEEYDKSRENAQGIWNNR